LLLTFRILTTENISAIEIFVKHKFQKLIKNLDFFFNSRYYRYMEEIGERIKEIRIQKRLNQGEFAKRMEISQSLLSGIENGNEALSDRNLKIICLEFGVNREWLLTGEGAMFDKKPDPPLSKAPVIGPDGKPLEGDEAELIGIYRELDKPIQHKVFAYAHDMKNAQENVARTEPEKGAEENAG
jgi:transcriptional regulator with XRE-family HTH domain